ncbi:MAG: hypothetical protein ACFHHU_16080 [Porticoccaceae bacterium]|uniref:hypothetical protein n=1 Tax=Thalassospira sp. TaxID=1912094 RepID=UPI003A8A09C2
MSEMTINDLRVLYSGTPQGAHLDFVLAQNHPARVTALQKSVDFACNYLEQDKHKNQKLDEDQLSLQICAMLRMAGFQVAHDRDLGGHPDVVVEGKDLFLWLAEAKKHSSYEWLNKGFNQLSARYSTGVHGQDHGEILVYCYVKDAKAMLAKWRDELKGKNPKVTTEDSPCGNPLLFCSKHKHGSSGMDFHVRHKAIALYWDPKDK